MTNDISNKTILILVILTIVVSTLGTLTVLDSVQRVESSPEGISQGTPSVSGEVKLAIVKEPEPVLVSGRVIMEITK